MYYYHAYLYLLGPGLVDCSQGWDHTFATDRLRERAFETGSAMLQREM